MSRRLAPLVQGSYYLLTGCWPLASMRTFELASGEKTDKWLVKTTGLLLAVIGAVLLLDGLREPEGKANLWLGPGGATALTAIDVTYVSKRRIPPVYLLDATLEILFLGMWAKSRRQ